LTEEATAKKRSAVTDTRGAFLISALAPGSYWLVVERMGFQKHSRRLTLAVDQELSLELALIAGNHVDTIEVTATRIAVKTDSAALGTAVENRNITGLPLDGRNFYELALLLPGAAPAAPGSAGSLRGDIALNINGAREDSNNFLLDGIYNGDPKLNTFGVTPPVEAIQEFEVLTSVYDASFGRNAGGQVNVVLKSGTNALHGSAYEFFRNGALDAQFLRARRSIEAAVSTQSVLGRRWGARSARTARSFSRITPRRHSGNQCADARRTHERFLRRPAGHQSIHSAAVSRQQDSTSVSKPGGRSHRIPLSRAQPRCARSEFRLISCRAR
jgi:hypothetical protein